VGKFKYRTDAIIVIIAKTMNGNVSSPLSAITVANDFSKVVFHLDSLLIANQINGKYKIKNENLRNLFLTVKSLETKIPTKIFYIHVYREKNKLADFLVNKCLDGVSRTSRS